jgi:1-deoxy-D-xylulose-5-phosphate reductoisomerase
MKKIAILGSTGSIGVNSLKVIELNPEKYQVLGLTAGRNIELLLRQIEKFHPVAVSILEEELAFDLRKRLKKDSRTEVYSGTNGFIRVATLKDGYPQ